MRHRGRLLSALFLYVIPAALVFTFLAEFTDQRGNLVKLVTECLFALTLRHCKPTPAKIDHIPRLQFPPAAGFDFTIDAHLAVLNQQFGNAAAAGKLVRFQEMVQANRCGGISVGVIVVVEHGRQTPGGR